MRVKTHKICYILNPLIKTVRGLLSVRPKTKTCSRDDLSAEGSSQAELTEQGESETCSKSLHFACYGLLCLPGSSILLRFYWDMADKSVFIAAVASVRAVYD